MFTPPHHAALQRGDVPRQHAARHDILVLEARDDVVLDDKGQLYAVVAALFERDGDAARERRWISHVYLQR